MTEIHRMFTLFRKCPSTQREFCLSLEVTFMNTGDFLVDVKPILNESKNGFIKNRSALKWLSRAQLRCLR